MSSVDDIECIGITLGIIGEIKLAGLFQPHLLIIKDSAPVGVLYPPHLVYKIKSICILSADEPDAALTPCSKHSTVRSLPPPSTHSPPGKSKLFDSSIMRAVKSAGSSIRSTTSNVAVLATNQVKSKVGIRDQKNLEKKISEELHKIFDETDSFYYCLDGDITNNLQRKNDEQSDERFFWNVHMLKDIIALNVSAEMFENGGQT